MLEKNAYFGRWQRARDEMRYRSLDALLITEKFNFWYFTTHLSREFDKKMRPQMLLLPLTGQPALITFAADEAHAKHACPDAILNSYPDVPFQSSVLIEALRNAGLADGRIGFEFGSNDRMGIAITHLKDLQRALPTLKIVDAEQIFDRLRMVKSADEVDSISKACEISLSAWNSALRKLRVGMTNNQVAAILGAELCLAGHDFNLPGHVTVGNGVSGRDGYKDGDVLWCDFGATFEGYQADLSRRAVFGQPSMEQLRHHEEACDILHSMLRLIRPGVRACDVAQEVVT